MTFDQPLPASLSPSRLADFQTCPRRYQHASIERRPQPATYATAKGRFVHYVLERLFLLESGERTLERAREFLEPAIATILTPEVRLEIGLDEAMMTKLLGESETAIQRYFEMEDPRTIRSEGVELRVGVDVEDTPLFGILDRLDRNDDGTLSIVDYKTGALPNRHYDSQTFANTELYAAMCEAKLGERPSKIRLLYVTHAQAVERPVSEIVLKARTGAATKAWVTIKRYYDDGDFPATPSRNACRFCAFKGLCRKNGVPVPAG